MRISNTLYSLLLTLPMAACAKSGSTPESENAYEVSQAVPVQESPDEHAEGIANTVSDPRPMGPAPEPIKTEPEATAALTDEQIVKITITVNEGEIAQAKLAQAKSKNPGVKKFASHMISEHTKNEQKGNAWAKKSNVTPADSTVESSLHSDADKTLTEIGDASAADLDKTYVDAQVKQHEAVLDLLDTKLIPSATNADLKAALEKTRGMVEHHAAQAKALQQKIENAQSKGARSTQSSPTAG